jgi:hypothetical protein
MTPDRLIPEKATKLTISLDELRDAVSAKLAQLLKDDEAGWHEAARWLEKRALEEGIDLFAHFESPEEFSHSLVEGMRFHTDFEQHFPNGVTDLARFEIAEELFWHLLPHSERDCSAFELNPPAKSKRLFRYLKRLIQFAKT